MKMTFERDVQIDDIIANEWKRQNQCLDLIASQSLAPSSIREISGSILTNRTIEGYPGKRYYAGGKYLDELENLAIERAKELFGAEHVNVQTHCGANTNLAVYLATLKPGDTILAMNLSAGGHLSHGHPMNVGAKLYKFIHYGVERETGLIDYDEVERLALECKPSMIVGGASSYPREIDWKRLKNIADKVSAMLLADVAHTAGLIAAGIHLNPVPYADFVNFSLYKTLPGPRGGCILCKEKYGSLVDKAVFPGIQGSIMPNLIGAKAACFKMAMSDEFKVLAEQVVNNAKQLSSSLELEGINLVTGGTDSHIILVDVRNKGITGKVAENVLERIGITVNRNVIPFDPEKPWIASGIRIGTTVASMRGMKEKEMELIARIISRCLDNTGNDDILEQLSSELRSLCERFPIDL